MKDNVIYNQSDNQVMVKTNGDLIYIVCNKEEQHFSSDTSNPKGRLWECHKPKCCYCEVPDAGARRDYSKDRCNS